MKPLRTTTARILCAALLLAPITALGAESKPKPYTLEKCIVSDESLGDMGEPVVFVYKGQEIKLCCKECRNDFDKDPAKFIKKLEAAKPVIKNISVEEFEKLRGDKKNVVLDVRTPKEFAAGHVPGAVNIDVNAPDFEKKLATLDPNKTYLVHCRSGNRSAKACEILGKLKFGQLYHFDGGMRAWEKAGNKAER